MTAQLLGSVLAFQDNPKFYENEVLDEWRIPFGDWYDQAVDWVSNNWGGFLNAVEEFFKAMIDFVNEDILLGVPWLVIVIAFFFLGWLLQNIRVGAFAALALTICGLLGTAYWSETARTIGYISVAVLLCSLIGIPIGIACGRNNAVWQAVRPILDAMQVVHSFVYMLPFIYFFGIGPVSATIVTMVFAIPPLIRLTNLGIRQVPEDVVEASRAFGQSEARILRDVQLPLARPAIMTGINQCLLLSISMLGIAALMGAGGLAKFMFRALNEQDPALSGSAGLSFFLVAVVLDRLTQREGTSEGMFHRMRLAWVNRRTPEALLESEDDAEDAKQVPASVSVKFQPVDAKERSAMMITLGGAVVMLVSMFLTWNSGGGWFSSFSRRADELGEEGFTGAYNGFAASGGSWFGFILILFSVIVIISVGMMMSRPGRTPRWLNPDGAAIFAIASLVMTVAYVLGSPSDSAVASRGIGSVIALVAGVIMAVGAIMWLRAAKQSPIRPLPNVRVMAPLVFAIIGSLIIIGGGFSAWVFDERSDVVLSEEDQAEIDRLTAEAREADTAQQAAFVGKINAIRAAASNSGQVATNGLAGNGPGFGWTTIVASLAAVVTAALAAGFAFIDRDRQWFFGTVTVGLGAGIAAVALGFVGTTVRATDPNIVSGVGVLFAMIGASTIVIAGRSVINDFVRSPVFAKIEVPDDGPPQLKDPEVAEELGEVEAAYANAGVIDE